MIALAEAAHRGLTQLTKCKPANEGMRTQYGQCSYLEWCCQEARRLRGHLWVEVVYKDTKSGRYASLWERRGAKEAPKEDA